uniref:Uncharacterized protein n=1 Tax=Romanomermis culicivorax TaxID=13658 RepID=A0A915IWJ3_ROMCU
MTWYINPFSLCLIKKATNQTSKHLYLVRTYMQQLRRGMSTFTYYLISENLAPLLIENFDSVIFDDDKAKVVVVFDNDSASKSKVSALLPTNKPCNKYGAPCDVLLDGNNGSRLSSDEYKALTGVEPGRLTSMCCRMWAMCYVIFFVVRMAVFCTQHCLQLCPKPEFFSKTEDFFENTCLLKKANIVETILGYSGLSGDPKYPGTGHKISKVDMLEAAPELGMTSLAKILKFETSILCIQADESSEFKSLKLLSFIFKGKLPKSSSWFEGVLREFAKLAFGGESDIQTVNYGWQWPPNIPYL